MRKQSKCRKKNRKNRDCTKCKFYAGFASKNYFKCEAFKSEEYPRDIDIYDRDVLKKGTCTHFVPKEVDLDDHIHVNDAMECSVKKDDQSLPDQE